MRLHGNRERERCPICGSDDIAKRTWAIPFSQSRVPVIVNGASTSMLPILDANAEVFLWSVCRSCNSIFLDPYDGCQKEAYRESEHHVRRMHDLTVAQGYADQWANAIAPFIHIMEGVILDAGCGTGQYLSLAREYSGRWSKVVGVELSRPSVEWVNRNVQGAQAHQADLDRLYDLDAVVAPGSVDFAICSEVLEHTEEPWAVLQNLGRALKKGGRLFFTCQSVGGQLPVRPGEPIYASRDGIERMLVGAGIQKSVSFREECGRWKIVVEKP